MNQDTPPQNGLTRTPTGYPHPLYPGWYIEPAEMRAIQRRADQRGEAMPDPAVSRAAVHPDTAPYRERKRRDDWRRRTGEEPTG